MMKKKWLAASAIALIALAGCSTANGGTSDTVATTKVGNVTKDELYNAMKQNSGSQVLYTLLIQKVAIANVSDKEALNKSVSEFITARKTAVGGEDAFKALLTQNGFENEEAFKAAVLANQAIAQVIKEKTTVTDEEITAAYENWETPVKAAHILVSDEAKAKELIAQLNNGADFATLAKENSLDKENASNGGSLGEFKPSTMVSEFAAALKELKVGEYSQTPVKTSFGYHIIKLEANPGKTTLEQDKEAVRADLIQTKISDTTHQQEVVSELLKTANIEIKDTFLANALKNVLNKTTNSTTN